MPLNENNIINSLVDKGRAYEICEILKTNEYKTAQQIAEKTELAYNNVHNYLKHLVKLNIVEVKDEKGINLRYKLISSYSEIKEDIEKRQEILEDAKDVKRDIKSDLTTKNKSEVIV